MAWLMALVSGDGLAVAAGGLVASDCAKHGVTAAQARRRAKARAPERIDFIGKG